ncbi:MAG: T9SS type A sorting domain-containing protein [Bacteroidia bacterium]|nr:T9SS type A sorting domain-containing protein [Bacteroidia bacterium]
MLTALHQNYIIIENGLDKGNTTLLLNAVQSNISSGKLKNLLIGNSPLSDTVIFSLTNSNKPVPPGIYKEIMTPNLPVSDNVYPYFKQKLVSLPPGIANQLVNMQAYNPSYITLTSIQRTIDYNENLRQQVLNKLIKNQVDSSFIDEAVDVLLAEQSIVAKQVLVATFLSDGNITDASLLLSQIQPDDEETSDWIEFNNLLLELISDGKTYYELDTNELQMIRFIAEKCPGGLATANAQSILNFLYGEEFPFCDESSYSLKKLSANLFENIENSDNDFDYDTPYLGINNPNPCSDFTNIPYYLPDETEGVKIIIMDINGKIIAEFDAMTGFHTLDINVKELSAGVYFYSLKTDGAIVQHRKMIIIK